MEPDYFLQTKLDNIPSVFMEWNKMYHLKKSINNHHDYILSPLSPREDCNEIHTYITPQLQTIMTASFHL